MNSSRSFLTSLIFFGLALSCSGCKKAAAPAAAPVLNSDGSTTNPNGSVTMPTQQAGNQAGNQAGKQPASGQPASTGQQLAIRNPDGSITNPDGSVTYPAGSRVARREDNPVPQPQSDTRSTPQLQSGSAAAGPATAPSIKAGTSVVVRLNTSLAASRNEVGDRWSGVLDQSIPASGGGTAFARGTAVSGTVVASKGKGRFKGAGALGIELTEIGREHVSSSEYEVASKGRGRRTAVFGGGGAGLGALIGGLAGGGKGALIGGLAGAGAGTATGAYTGSRDVVIPAESAVRFRLTSSLSVP